MKLVSWYIALQVFISSISWQAFIFLLATGTLILYLAYVFLKMSHHKKNQNYENKELVLTSLSDALKGGRNMADTYKMGE